MCSAHVSMRSAYVSIRQHTSACVNICSSRRLSMCSAHVRMRSAYVNIRQRMSACAQHTSAYVSVRQHALSIRQHTSAYVSMRSAYVSIRQRTSACAQHTSAYVSVRQHALGIRQHTSAYVSIRQHTSEYVRIRQICQHMLVTSPKHAVAQPSSSPPPPTVTPPPPPSLSSPPPASAAMLRCGRLLTVRACSSSLCAASMHSTNDTFFTWHRRQHTSAYVNIRQHTSAYVSIYTVGCVDALYKPHSLHLAHVQMETSVPSSKLAFTACPVVNWRLQQVLAASWLLQQSNKSAGVCSHI
jgi:hypothetical protein